MKQKLDSLVPFLIIVVFLFLIFGFDQYIFFFGFIFICLFIFAIQSRLSKRQHNRRDSAADLSRRWAPHYRYYENGRTVSVDSAIDVEMEQDDNEDNEDDAAIITSYHPDIENQTCPVCIEVVDDDLEITKCQHIFHQHCLNEWDTSELANGSLKKSCPTCRKKNYRIK